MVDFSGRQGNQFTDEYQPFLTGSLSKSEKEGTKDQGTFRTARGSPLALLPFPGLFGLPSGSFLEKGRSRQRRERRGIAGEAQPPSL